MWRNSKIGYCINAIIFTVLLCPKHVACASQYEEEVLEVMTQSGSVLSEPLIGLRKNSVYYFPLVDLAKVLGVSIEFPAENKFMVYLSAKDSKSIDLQDCGRPSPNVVCNEFIFVRGVAYATMGYLREQLAWPIELDTKNMRLMVNATGVQPEKSVENKEVLKPLEIRRDSIGLPSMLIEEEYSVPSKVNTFSLNVVNPLLQQDSELFFYEKGGQNRTRWTISRQSIQDKEDEGSLQPKFYEAVSTQSADMKYLFTPTQIVGASFSNRRFDQNFFDSHNIYERGPPRWRVELYMNDVFFAETIIGPDGQFSFLDVPLFYGNNKLVFKLTSPLGKTTEYSQYYNVSSEFQGANRMAYQFSYGQIEGESSYLGSMQAIYGITSSLSMQVGTAEFPLNDVKKNFYQTGAYWLQPSYSVGGGYLSTYDGSEGAISITPKINLPGVMLTTEYTSFRDFRTRVINSLPDDLKQISVGKASASSHISVGIPMTLQAQFEEDRYENSTGTQEGQLKAYSMLNGKSGLLELTKQWPSSGSPDLYLEFGNYLNLFRIKYGVLLQQDKYSKSKIQIEANLPADLFASANIEAPQSLSDSSYTFGLSKVIYEVLSELRLSGSNSDTELSLVLSTNIKSNPKKIEITSSESYQQGRIELLAFVDTNGNGVFDNGESIFSHLRVLHVQRQKDYELDRDGRAVIPGLSPYQRISLDIVKESIPNIYLTAPDFKKDYVLTPGQTLQIQIPLISSYDLKGTIENEFYKKLVPFELLSLDRKILQTGTSRSNGQFKIDDVPAGDYILRVNPDFIEKNNLISVPEEVEVKVEGKPGVKKVPVLKIFKLK